MLSVRRCTETSKEKIGKKSRSRRQQPKTERNNFMFRIAKRTFRGGAKRVWSCGKSISRVQLLRWTKRQSALKVSTEICSRLCGSNAAMASDRVVSDLMLPLWEEVFVAFFGCKGQCASAHNRHAMECSREIRAVRRAFLLPFEERADGPQGAGSAGMQKKPAFVPDSEAFNSFIGAGFLVPELKRGSEASDGLQAGNVINEALHVVGLHGSGDKISLSSCRIRRWRRWP